MVSEQAMRWGLGVGEAVFLDRGRGFASGAAGFGGFVDGDAAGGWR